MAQRKSTTTTVKLIFAALSVGFLVAPVFLSSYQSTEQTNLDTGLIEKYDVLNSPYGYIAAFKVYIIFSIIYWVSIWTANRFSRRVKRKDGVV